MEGFAASWWSTKYGGVAVCAPATDDSRAKAEPRATAPGNEELFMVA
jgi:hypothetical protein